jgi:choline dehydrogenase-like flavoprotein
VLLLEEGPEAPDWLVKMPRGYGRLLADDRYVSRFPVARTGSTEVWLRGKLLGGTSSVNGTVWLRGQPEDFDSFARYGMVGWGWSEILPYFRRLEDFEGGADALHGSNGPVPIRTHPARDALAQAVIAAGIDQGLPPKSDQNGAGEGIGYIQHNIDRRSRRVSAKRAFLDPILSRNNLAIETHVRADHILFRDRRAIGVVCSARGESIQFACEGEIVIAAGALASPLILQRSGVGDSRALTDLGIAVRVHSPAVGKNLQEHLIVPLQFRTNDSAYSQNREFSGFPLLRNLMRYFLAGSGPLATGAHQVGAAVRSTPMEPVPDLRIMYAPFSRADGTRQFEDEPGVQMVGFALQPESRGDISIVSSDPGAPPRIRPNYLSTETDRRRNIALVRSMRKLMGHRNLARFIRHEAPETRAAQTDDEVQDLIIRRGSAGFHTTSTCAAGNGESVVDSALRVRGVESLRVVDCSIFPAMLAAHTNAPAMAAGWLASDLIVADRER